MSISIIIPVCNEEKILKEQIVRLLKKMQNVVSLDTYEILLIENGSSDNTRTIAHQLARQFPKLRVIALPSASYGQAYKIGLQKATYNITVQFDIDFWDTDFIQKALGEINNYDIVIGSKNMKGSHDKRSFIRTFLSKLIEVAIQKTFNVGFTDTHGLKMVKKQAVVPVIHSVQCQNHFFDTELLIRCVRNGASFIEFPVDLYEIRPSRFSFIKRSFNVMREFTQLLFLKRVI